MRLPFTTDHPECTPALRRTLLSSKPPTLTLSRPLVLPPKQGIFPRSVAIIGARKAVPPALDWAKALAKLVVDTGGVVLSGGALGIDGAAHEGALEAGGITWCAAPTEPDTVSPDGHRELFKRIEASDGGMLWTCAPGTQTGRPLFHVRNSILVALAHAVIVVQAGAKSGSLGAARKALAINCPVYVVRPPGWDLHDFSGSRTLLEDERVRPLDCVNDARALFGAPPLVEPKPGDDPESDPGEPAQLSLNLSSDQANLFQKVTQSPQHVDEIAHSVGIRPGQAATLLLTLALENVVVEGPSGFFRRQQLL